jgi:DDE superfamily endonuclease
VWFRFGVNIICSVLKTDERSRIRFPDDEQIHEFKQYFNARHPVLEDVFCVCDGLKLSLQSTKGYRKQGRFFNGWYHGHYITNLFVFAPTGMIIIFAVINAPGSVHDSTLSEWGNFYYLLNKIYERTGGKCCMDSAFAAKNNPAVIRSSERYDLAQNTRELLIFKEATSLRQSAEWGMRALQSAWPRMTDKIRHEETGQRAKTMMAMALLYNFRCSRVGLNQIRTVYTPNLVQDPSIVYFNI